MSDWLYDWLADMTLPALAGIGGIVVGTGAMVAAFTSNKVAEQSYALAQQVRDDEQRREADAAHERYRDHLFRTVEPTISAMLEHRAELRRVPEMGPVDETEYRSTALARLRLIMSVTAVEDSAPLNATVRSYTGAINTGRPEVVRGVLGQLVLHLAEFLEEGRDDDALVRAIDGVLPEMVAFADAEAAASSRQS